MGRQPKFKVFGKKNDLVKNNTNGEKNDYGVISKGEEEVEVKKTFYYI